MKKRSTHFPAIVRRGAGRRATWVCILTLVASFVALVCTSMAAVTEEALRDALLGKTSVDLATMDLNGDGVVDVADLVAVLKQNRIEVSFSTATSEIDETTGTHKVVLTSSRSLTGVIRYSVGGTATSGTDYQALPGTVAINGTTATITLTILSDKVYEGTETLELRLLPDTTYALGTTRTHTVSLKDNPVETQADFLFVLGAKTPGVQGDPTLGKGFPSALMARKARIRLAFSKDAVKDAWLNIPKSLGLPASSAGDDLIQAKSVSTSGTTLKLTFSYGSKSTSFVSNMSITEFSSTSPSLGTETSKPLQNELTLTVNGLDIPSGNFATQVLEGNFSLSIAGVLNDPTGQFFTDTLLGGMQQ